MRLLQDFLDWLLGRQVWDMDDLPFATPAERLVFCALEQGMDASHVRTDIRGGYINDRRPT